MVIYTLPGNKIKDQEKDIFQVVPKRIRIKNQTKLALIARVSLIEEKQQDWEYQKRLLEALLNQSKNCFQCQNYKKQNQFIMSKKKTKMRNQSMISKTEHIRLNMSFIFPELSRIVPTSPIKPGRKNHRKTWFVLS